MKAAPDYSLFRKVAILEAWSYLILLGIAMPIKYIFTIPEAVKYPGWAHGGLFVAYFVLLAQAAYDGKWPISRMAWGVLASVIPAGPWLLEKQLFPEPKA
jgi:integral membrane protein